MRHVAERGTHVAVGMRSMRIRGKLRPACTHFKMPVRSPGTILLWMGVLTPPGSHDATRTCSLPARAARYRWSAWPYRAANTLESVYL